MNRRQRVYHELIAHLWVTCSSANTIEQTLSINLKNRQRHPINRGKAIRNGLFLLGRFSEVLSGARVRLKQTGDHAATVCYPNYESALFGLRQANEFGTGDVLDANLGALNRASGNEQRVRANALQTDEKAGHLSSVDSHGWDIGLSLAM